jgi:intergrase/recombinase
LQGLRQIIEKKSSIKNYRKIGGEIGLTIKFGIFSGLREDEILYIHKKEICIDLIGCRCEKLHVVSKPNGITVVMINWFRGHKKCYFTLIPRSVE